MTNPQFKPSESELATIKELYESGISFDAIAALPYRYFYAGHGGHGAPVTHLLYVRFERGRDAREGHGPPPWAPAHGWRCKQAGNRPGSPAFKDCIKASKQ